MPNVSINIPAALVDDVSAAIDSMYGEDVQGMTDKQKLAHHIKQSLAAQVKATRKRADAAFIAARDARGVNNESRASAQASDDAAVKAAEAAVEAAADTDLAGIA